MKTQVSLPGTLRDSRVPYGEFTKPRVFNTLQILSRISLIPKDLAISSHIAPFVARFRP